MTHRGADAAVRVATCAARSLGAVADLTERALATRRRLDVPEVVAVTLARRVVRRVARTRHVRVRRAELA